MGNFVGFAAAGDEPTDDVVDNLELVGVFTDVPVSDGDDVVATAGLRLGVDGQQVLPAPVR